MFFHLIKLLPVFFKYYFSLLAQRISMAVLNGDSAVCCKQLNPLLSLFLETLAGALAHIKCSAYFPSH